MTDYRIAEMAQQYLRYDMIEHHTELPDFPHYRTRLLHAFLSKGSRVEAFSELYALVTSIVQMGLDTHDLVPETNREKENKATRGRQLKVLAGDYFSSRFYHLLSQAGQIETIRQLSASICEVNRMKLNFYLLMKQVKMTAEDYIRHSVDIKMQLFLSFSHLMEGIFSSYWPELLRGFTRCEVLLQEISRAQSTEGLRGSWGFWHVLQKGTKDERKQLLGEETESGKLQTLWLKYNITTQLYSMLEEQLRQVQSKINQLGSERIVQELRQVLEPFLRYLSAPKVMEEI